MTDEPAAIRASFSDFKLIRTRKICQLVLEVPIEEADSAIAALGGVPQPHSDRWVAVARLNDVVKPETEPKEKQKWEDLKLSMQAGIRCKETAFWRYLNDEYAFPSDIDTEEKAADSVRWFCGVPSRKGFDDTPEAAERWRDLNHSYQAWLKLGE